MKLKKYVSLAFGLVLLSGSSYGAVTIATQFGQAFLVDGTTLVPDGTLWAAIVDTNNNSALPGMSVNSSLAQTAATGQAGIDSINGLFAGKSLALGSLFGGDAVIAMGGFASGGVGVAGATAPTLSLSLGGANGTATGRIYGFYYFPGVTFTSEGETYNVGGSIGGINTTLADANTATDGMIIPTDTFVVTQGASTANLGGIIPTSSFTAVALVPEPSAALLGAIGALGLLRRRRN
jgi:hypothetical protein